MEAFDRLSAAMPDDLALAVDIELPELRSLPEVQAAASLVPAVRFFRHGRVLATVDAHAPGRDRAAASELERTWRALHDQRRAERGSDGDDDASDSDEQRGPRVWTSAPVEVSRTETRTTTTTKVRPVVLVIAGSARPHLCAF